MPDRQLYHEQELLIRISKGDESSFAAVFDYYRPKIYTLALRYTGKTWLAEEVVQDTFLKVWLKRALLPGIDNFGGWLYTIAQGFTINTAQKARREQENARDWLLFQSIHPPVGAISTEENDYQSILKLGVERLPRRQQEIYKLIKEESYSRQQVAERLNVSPETVKSNLDHAMRHLRAWCMAYLDRTGAGVLFLLVFRKYF